MEQYIGSGNSRYFACAEGKSLSMIRNEREVWNRRLRFPHFDLVGLGNNGRLVIRSEEGAFSYHLTGEEFLGPLEQFSRERLVQTSSHLKQARLDQFGERLFVERVTLQSRLSEKIFQLLSDTQVEKNTALHELVFCNLVSGDSFVYYKYLADRKKQQSFIWETSPGMEYLAAVRSQKGGAGGYDVTVIEVAPEMIHEEFVLKDVDVRELRVSRDGTLLVDHLKDGNPRMLIADSQGSQFLLTMPDDYKVLHLYPNQVAVLTRPDPFLLVKDFSDQIVHVADLRSLAELGIQFQIIFNETGDLDIVTLQRGERRFLHTTLDRFVIDAKRWELMAEQLRHSREAEEQLRERHAEHEAEAQAPKARRMQAIEVLASTAEESRKAREKRRSGEVGAVLKTLEGLKLQLVTGKITEVAYQARRREMEEHLGRLKGKAVAAGSAEVAAPAEAAGSVEADLPKPHPHRKKSTRKEPETRVVIPAPEPVGSSVPAESGKAAELLEALEKRFIHGEISEKSYLELKSKYERKLGRGHH